MTARRTREHILQAFRALHAELGRAPGKGVLLSRTGIKESEVLYFWPRMRDLAIEAKADPNTMQSAVSDDDVFADYAKLCLHVGHIPTEAEARIATRQLETRTHTAAKRFGSLATFKHKFKDWLANRPEPELRAVLTLSGWDSKPTQLRSERAVVSKPTPAPPIRPFLPAGLQWLEPLSRGERPPFEDPSAPVSLIFEQRVGDAFRCLGFEVRQLGQGKGRKADCVAISRQNGYAVIVDAKVRTDGYVLGTEDRKFLEYAVTHSSELVAEGISRIYLCVVAASFRASDLTKLRLRLTISPIRSVVLLTAAALVKRTEGSIRDRYLFSLKDIEADFGSNSVIDT